MGERQGRRRERRWRHRRLRGRGCAHQNRVGKRESVVIQEAGCIQIHDGQVGVEQAVKGGINFGSPGLSGNAIIARLFCRTTQLARVADRRGSRRHGRGCWRRIGRGESNAQRCQQLRELHTIPGVLAYGRAQASDKAVQLKLLNLLVRESPGLIRNLPVLLLKGSQMAIELTVAFF